LERLGKGCQVEMKLLKKHIDKDLSGFVSFRPEYDEDLWWIQTLHYKLLFITNTVRDRHAYNLIVEGDQVRAAAYRQVLL